MRRRDFITLLGGTAAGWPVTARAQQQPATPAVGFLADGTPEGFAPRLAAVKRGLYETGFTDGQNVAIEPRWAQQHPLGQLNDFRVLLSSMISEFYHGFWVTWVSRWVNWDDYWVGVFPTHAMSRTLRDN